MADTRSLTFLFEAISRQDWSELRSSALEIAAQEETKGNRKAAGTLRGALDGVGSNGATSNGRTESQLIEFQISRALVRCPEGPSLDEIAMRADKRKILTEILEEFEAESALREAGLDRRTSLLFHGPPGCGKTVSAIALAKSLGIPAYVVRFNALIGSYLGQTALNLREVFRFAAQNKCVLILDEIDVLGKRRGSQMDVGELDRIVVGLMQELDFSRPKGLIVGASNLSDHLDDALWRRFDVQLELPKPKPTEILNYARKRAKPHNITVTESLKKKLSGLSDYASAEKLILDQARRKVVKQHLANGRRKK